MEKSVASVCPACGVGCGLYLTTSDGHLTGPDYMREHPVNQGALCANGNASLELAYHTDRLLYPQKRSGEGFERISWDEAFSLIASNLQRLQIQYGPESLGFLASAKATNEENYLFQKLARLLGTHNIDHLARRSLQASVDGLIATLGGGEMTNPITDLAKSDCIFVIGSNFAENHPIVSRWVLDGRERGAMLIVADPRFTPTAWPADLYLPLLPGSDVALINAMLNVIIAQGLWNDEFVRERTEGFDELCDVVANYPPTRAEQLTGVPAKDIIAAARAFSTSPAASIVYSLGVTQQTDGSNLVKSLADLALLTGQIGRPGTGINPLRGQGNSQGACDMGVQPDFFPGHQPVTDQVVREKFASIWGMPAGQMSAQPGLSASEMIAASESGSLHGMLLLGENPFTANVRSDHLVQALRKLDFLAVIEIFPSETTKLADVVLPGALFIEKCGSRTASDRRVQWFDRAIEPAGEAMVEWAIISRLAGRLGLGRAFEYSDEEDILAEIRSITPSYAGIYPERLRITPGGIPWPCWSKEHLGASILYAEGFKNPPDNRGRMIPVEFQPPGEVTSSEFPLILICGQAGKSRNPPHTKKGRKKNELRLMVQLHPQTAERFGISDQADGWVSTRRGKVQVRVQLTSALRPEVLFMPIYFLETAQLTRETLDTLVPFSEYGPQMANITPIVNKKGGKRHA